MIQFNRDLHIPSLAVSLDWFRGPRKLPTLHLHVWRWSLTINSPWHFVSDID